MVGRGVSLTALVMALAAPGVVVAADSAPDRTVSEVVVTAAPYAVSEQSLTSSVNIITTQDLNLAPPVGLGDLLSGLPGLRSTFFGPGASRPVIRGLSGPRVLLLQNGVGQIDVSDVSPDHAVPSDPAEASRIEVLRGPSTLAYGGSGIGGVVNVIDDRVPSSPAQGGVDGRVSGSVSSVDDGWNVSGHLKAGEGPFVFAIEGVRRKTQDYDVPSNPLSDRLAAELGVVPEATHTVRNTDTDVTEYGIGGSYVGSKGYFGASVRRTEQDYGIPFAQIDGEEPDEKVGIRLRQTRVDVRGQSNIDFGPFAQVKFSGGWAKYEHAEINVDNGDIGTQFSSKGEEGRLEFVQKESGGWQGAVGFQALRRNRTAVGDEVLVPSTDIDEYGVFTLQRVDKGGWGLEGGIRLDQRKLQTDLTGRVASEAAAELGLDWSTAPDYRSFTNLSGSGAVFVRPVANVFLSVNLSHNERAPTEYELFADGPHDGTRAFEIGDPTLGREKVNSIEGTARYTTDAVALEGHLYYAKYSDFIQETPTGQIEDDLPVQQFQAVDAKFVGAEATAKVRLWGEDSRSIHVESSYDWVRGTSDQGPVPRIPPYSLTGRLTYGSDRLNGRVEVRYVAEQDRVVSFELPTDAYTMVNAFLSYKPLAAQELSLFVEGRNLTDVEAREHTSFLKDIAPLPGRNIRAGVAYAF